MNVKFLSLGGLGKIGENCYIFQKRNEIIIVDAGIAFNDIEGIINISTIPNFDYLIENRKKVRALFVTHGHEDHIGAIPYLLEKFPSLVVHGSRFSINLIKQKFSDSNLKNKRFSEFSDETVVRTAEFLVKFFRVTHSIPEAFGLFIETITEKTSIIVTGDFKFDWTGIGEKTDIIKLANISDNCGGVDLLLSDSTNAEIKGNTPSEKKVVARIESIITNAKGRVIITSFASNVYRLKKTIEIAKQNGRVISLLGSSLTRMFEVIKKTGLWQIDNSVFIDSKDINKHPKDKLIIFCTGSQGETKAVLSKLSMGEHQDLKIMDDDAIILTSSPIMSNSKNIESINNKLSNLGAKIFENGRNDLLHASGHACEEDLKLLIAILKPKNFIPFHGDKRMLIVHGKIASDSGVNKENIFICDKGEVINSNFSNIQKKTIFFKDGKINNSVESNYIINNKVIPSDEIREKIELRKSMYNNGIVILTLNINFRTKKLKSLPGIHSSGFINIQKNKTAIFRWRKDMEFYVKKVISNEYINNIKDFKELFSTRLSTLIQKSINKKVPVETVMGDL